ncbi:MAG TPA: DUF4388 domain-containing protein [Cyanophyceae cyanobacterium]
MSTTGFLTDFSLPEIFQLIDKGHRTGLLKLRGLPESPSKPTQIYYLWAYQGRIVAAANRLDYQGLVNLIEQCQMVSDRVFDKLIHWCCPINEPLGLYLKNQGVLRPEQLKRLFHVQVLQPVCALFQLKEGFFKFDQDVAMPTREMTGLSVPAVILNQYGLIQSLLEEIENQCLNFKALPFRQLDEAPLNPVSCSLYSRRCDRKACSKTPCQPSNLQHLPSKIT